MHGSVMQQPQQSWNHFEKRAVADIDERIMPRDRQILQILLADSLKIIKLNKFPDNIAIISDNGVTIIKQR